MAFINLLLSLLNDFLLLVELMPNSAPEPAKSFMVWAPPQLSTPCHSTRPRALPLLTKPQTY